MAYEIRSEDDLFEAIERIEAGEWEADGVLFVDWPRFEITIRGEDFDGGVPTRIMPAFLAFSARSIADLLGASTGKTGA